MLSTNKYISYFNRSVWGSAVAFFVFSLTFIFYVRCEKAIDAANEKRYLSYQIADELRQSSDDLTRMVRTYVLTGNPIYKQHYQEILDIRNGIKPRPTHYEGIYWDLVLSDDKRPSQATSKHLSLLERMKKIGFTPQEFAKLAEAKNNSDELTKIEFDAMKILESTTPYTHENQKKAFSMLHDVRYHKAKYAIMKPISEAYTLIDYRTQQAVKNAENTAIMMRILFILFGILLGWTLWRVRKALYLTLGGSLKQLHSHIVSLGSGDLSSKIQIQKGMENSILAWLSETQNKLAQTDAERTKAQKDANRMRNLYPALSQCNQAIVRCQNETELFVQICQNAIDYGEMKMAWIGLADEETKELKPSAYAGEGTDYLNELRISLDPSDPSSSGPTGTTFIEDHPFWCQDFAHDSATAKWHHKGFQFGWGSSAAIPIHRNGTVYGVFNIYSGDTNAFDEAAQKLLLEMGTDIDYALDNLDRVSARKKAEEALKESEQHLNTIIKTEPECVKIVDSLGKLIQINPAGLAMLEAQTLEEAQQCELTDYLLPKYRAAFIDLHKQVMNGQEGTLEFEVIGLKGRRRWLQTHAAPMRNANGEITSLLGVTRDITENKHTITQLQKLSQAVEQSSNAIVITDYKANIEYINAAFLKITGYTQAEVMGKNPRFLKAGITPQSVYDDMWLTLNRGETWHGELTNRKKDGTEYIHSTNIAPVVDGNGRTTHYIAIEEDISERIRNEEHIRYLANYDPLTGLPNRRQMDDHLNYTLSLAKRNEGHFAVMFLDLDHFKNINDTLGHKSGDLLLIELSKRLTTALREEDTVSRMGGDEFVLLLPETEANGAAQVAQKLLESICKPFLIEDHQLTVTASIGIALYPADGSNIESLTKNADTAMYRSKQEGRNDYNFFTEEMQKNSQRNLLLSNALRYALERNELHLVFQPQLSSSTTHVIGAEALLRWHHPEFGNVSPAEFIPIAEENGMIIPIGEWVLRTAVNQAKSWMDSGQSPIIIAVNISAIQFRQPNLPFIITTILEEVGLPPQYLEIELTEGVAMHDPHAAIKIMNKLNECGIRMSIDDFGTGYSSLAYLKKFKVYKLKIDQSFVRDISTDPEDKAIVSAVINMARSLGLQTIAEGVETIEQLEYLREQGCEEIQGYYYSKPLLPKQFENFITTHQKEN